MKKLYFVIILSSVFFILEYNSFAKYEPFYGPWADSSGGYHQPTIKFNLGFYDNRFGSGCIDNNFTGGVEFKEYGIYISKNDSIYITINESNVPNSSERIGLTFGIKYILTEGYSNEIRFTNAKLLTYGWSKEDTLKMSRIVAAVNNSKWSEIKRKFKNP
jgi:hypothetical protein